MEYNRLDDKALFDALEKAALAERLTNSEEWKLLDEVRKRAIDRWIDYFIFKMDSTNVADIEKVRSTLAIWKYDLFKTLEIIKQDGENAFQDLNMRGQIRQSEAEQSDVEQ